MHVKDGVSGFDTGTTASAGVCAHLFRSSCINAVKFILDVFIRLYGVCQAVVVRERRGGARHKYLEDLGHLGL